MAESRHRHKNVHHQVSHQQNGRNEQKTKSRKAGLILAVFAGLFGLAIGFFAVGTTTGIAVGGVIGILAGYLIGNSLDRTAAKNR